MPEVITDQNCVMKWYVFKHRAHHAPDAKRVVYVTCSSKTEQVARQMFLILPVHYCMITIPYTFTDRMVTIHTSSVTNLHRVLML